ncbi:MAG TPA: F0F1 ATP synthase subunit C, partial [Acidobacteria bacterium]|nr:F0F1 ATP synthase subunit C [Acidobacteriota bacterium]
METLYIGGVAIGLGLVVIGAGLGIGRFAAAAA